MTDIQNDRVVAKPRSHVPKNSEIPRGEPPEDVNQSLNDLLSGRKL